MNVEMPILSEEVDFNEKLEITIWCLAAVRTNMKGQFRGFDDSILSLCLDIVYRELHLQSGNDDYDFYCKVDALILKYT
jgi:hypothetical protein